MLEMPPAGEDHRHAVRVGRGDHFFVAPRAAGLDHGRDSGRRRLLDRIGEGKERVRGHHRAAGALARLAERNAHAVDAAHLTGAAAQQRLLFDHGDGVRFDVPDQRPGKSQIAPLGIAGRRLADDPPLVFGIALIVGVLDEQSALDLAKLDRPAGPRPTGRSAAAGRCPSISAAWSGFRPPSASKSGATMASINRPGSTSTSAAAASTDAIESQHRAEGALRVAVQRLPRGQRQRFGRRGAAGIVVLDHHHRRAGQHPHDRQGAVEIEQVVVRQFLAGELPRR